jgi:hypothetical protein
MKLISVRKPQLPIILTLLLWTSCFCQNKKETDLNKDHLIGNVKQLRQDIYVAKEIDGKLITGEKTVADSLSNFSKKYNEAGNLIELIDYNVGNEKFIKHGYIYNNGNRIEESFYNEESNSEKKFVFIYDSIGNELEENRYDKNNNLKDKFAFKYDVNGNLVELDIYNMYYLFHAIDAKYFYKYDAKGNLIEEDYSKTDGASWGEKNIYKYDVKGNRITKDYYNVNSHYPKGNLVMKHSYKYNDKRKLIEWNVRFADGSKLSELDFSSKYTYKYDSKNNLIEEKQYNENGILHSKETYLYEYDDKGNWIRKIINKDVIIIREIQYY